MSTYTARWYLCGGWGIDALVGRVTRDHLDTDIAIFQADQRTFIDHLHDWRLVGHDNNVPGATKEQWDGRWLEMPSHIHGPDDDGIKLDVQLNLLDGGEWVFNEAPRISLPLDRCTTGSAWGVPVLGAETMLYYKALPPPYRDEPRTPPRAHDHRDLDVLLPVLTSAQRSWLHDAVHAVDPGHEWLPRLESGR